MRLHAVVGMMGYARCGKDSVAKVLADDFGFLTFSFSDALYREVSQAFGVVETVLKAEATKEEHFLLPVDCTDETFTGIMAGAVAGRGGDFRTYRWSPREILQAWGTAYRREQDPLYWVRRAHETVSKALWDGVPGICNTSVRFLNEVKYIREILGGQLWRVVRPGFGPINDHGSETQASQVVADWNFVNRSTIEELRTAVHYRARRTFPT